MSSSRFDSFDPLHEPNGREDEERELEELRLPVLEHGAPKSVEHVVEPGQRSPVVRELVGAARCPANDCPTSAATKIAPKKSDSPFSTAKRFNRPPARPRSRARAPEDQQLPDREHRPHAPRVPGRARKEPRGIQSADATADLTPPPSRPSWWLDEAQAHLPEPAAPPLAGSLEVDVAVVGGGYTGLWTALALREREPSLSVAVLEARAIGDGRVGETAASSTATGRRSRPRRARRRRGAPARACRAGSSPPCAPSSSTRRGRLAQEGGLLKVAAAEADGRRRRTVAAGGP